jgi:ABC-2 type transport system ATP-binding protein
MISSRALTKRFGRIIAVDSIDFDVPRGQVTGFLGPNGAGKSTTIRMITGYLPPTAGTIRVAGRDVEQDGLAVRRSIGYLPETTPLYGEMRVEEFLRFRARLFDLPRAKRGAAIDLAMRRCWIDDVRRRPIQQLSRGYRQRIGLAAALLHDPPVLVLDEPTVGLDPAQIREVRRLIRELAGTHTVLLSTHILPEVELTCDRILMIVRGRIRAAGTLDELQQQAAPLRRVVVETDARGAEQALRGVPGVAATEVVLLDERWRRVIVTPADPECDIREGLWRALAGRGGVVRELRREAPTLEQLFARIIAEADVDLPRPTGAAGAPEAARRREEVAA